MNSHSVQNECVDRIVSILEGVFPGPEKWRYYISHIVETINTYARSQPLLDDFDVLSDSLLRCVLEVIHILSNYFNDNDLKIEMLIESYHTLDEILGDDKIRIGNDRRFVGFDLLKIQKEYCSQWDEPIKLDYDNGNGVALPNLRSFRSFKSFFDSKDGKFVCLATSQEEIYICRSNDFEICELNDTDNFKKQESLNDTIISFMKFVSKKFYQAPGGTNKDKQLVLVALGTHNNIWPDNQSGLSLSPKAANDRPLLLSLFTLLSLDKPTNPSDTNIIKSASILGFLDSCLARALYSDALNNYWKTADHLNRELARLKQIESVLSSTKDHFEKAQSGLLALLNVASNDSEKMLIFVKLWSETILSPRSITYSIDLNYGAKLKGECDHGIFNNKTKNDSFDLLNYYCFDNKCDSHFLKFELAHKEKILDFIKQYVYRPILRNYATHICLATVKLLQLDFDNFDEDSLFHPLLSRDDKLCSCKFFPYAEKFVTSFCRLLQVYTSNNCADLEPLDEDEFHRTATWKRSPSDFDATFLGHTIYKAISSSHSKAKIKYGDLETALYMLIMSANTSFCYPTSEVTSDSASLVFVPTNDDILASDFRCLFTFKNDSISLTFITLNNRR